MSMQRLYKDMRWEFNPTTYLDESISIRNGEEPIVEKRVRTK